MIGLVGLIVWVVVAVALVINGSPLTLLFYLLPWLLIGLGLISLAGLARLFPGWKMWKILAGALLTTILLASLSFPLSLTANAKIREAKALSAFDGFMKAQIQGQTKGETYCVTPNSDPLPVTDSSEYLVAGFDDLLGEYDFGVEFSDGERFQVNMWYQGDCWHLDIQQPR